MTIRIPAIAAACAALGLAACTDPARLDPNTDYTRDGAIVGGTFGAIAGLAATGNAKGAAIGTAVGAGAGALLGNQLDRQAAELRNSIANDQVVINRQGDVLVVTMPQDILFAIDSAQLSGAIQGDLAALARSMNNYPNTTAEIVGHTDNTGDAGANLSLSTRRAQAVSSVLIANGVAASRLTVIGRGEEAPVASNLTPEGRAQNRRVDILIRSAG